MNDPRTHQSLADRLSAEASSLSIADTPVEVVVARGRQRQHRRRTAVGLAAVVAIAGGSVATISVLSRPVAPPAAGTDDSTSAESTPIDTGSVDTTAAVTDTTLEITATTVVFPGEPPDGAVPAQLVPSNLVWNVVEPNSAEALGMIRGSVAGEGPYLAWSTSPAVQGANPDYRSALWRSDDGVAWQQVDTAPPISSFTPTLAQQGSRFLTFGTAPANGSGTIEAKVAFTDDLGASWSTTQLPIDAAALQADPTVQRVTLSPVALAADDATVMAIVNLTPSLDLARLFGGVEHFGYQFLPEGITLMGSCSTTSPSTVPAGSVPDETMAVATPTTAITDATIATVPCDDSLVGLHTWADLGVQPATVDALLGGGLRLMVSRDGGATFTAGTLPALGNASGMGYVQMATFDGGIVLSAVEWAGGQPIPAMFVTTDGSDWREVAAPPIPNVSGFASYQGQLVMSGSDVTGTVPLVAIGSPDTGWSVTALQGLLTAADGKKPNLIITGNMAVDAHGITLLAWVWLDPIAEAGGVEVSHDGLTLRMDDQSGNLRVLDAATGEQIGALSQGVPAGAVLRQDENGVVVQASPDAPEVVFAWTELDLARTAVFNASGGTAAPKAAILHSTDGLQWSRDNVADIAPDADPSSAGWVRSTGTQIQVASHRPRTPAGAVPEPLLLVGTPRS